MKPCCLCCCCFLLHFSYLITSYGILYVYHQKASWVALGEIIKSFRAFFFLALLQARRQGFVSGRGPPASEASCYERSELEVWGRSEPPRRGKMFWNFASNWSYLRQLIIKCAKVDAKNFGAEIFRGILSSSGIILGWCPLVPPPTWRRAALFDSLPPTFSSHSESTSSLLVSFDN